MRRTVTAILAPLIAILLALIVMPGTAVAKPSPPCCGQTLTIAKNKATALNPAPPTPGQVRVAKGTLSTQSNLAPIGSYSSVQTVVSVAPNGTVEVLNTTIYKLAKGTITTSGTETWTPDLAGFDDGTQNLAITGGTGIYAGVTGTASSLDFETNYFIVQFTFLNKR